MDLGRNRNYELTEEQTDYLKERGFVVFNREPLRDDFFPYVVLGPLRNYLGESEIRYLYSPNYHRATFFPRHPSVNKIPLLIKEIELMVGREMDVEGSLINTRSGEPIKVFMLDPNWISVTKELVEKYPSSFPSFFQN